MASCGCACDDVPAMHCGSRRAQGRRAERRVQKFSVRHERPEKFCSRRAACLGSGGVQCTVVRLSRPPQEDLTRTLPTSPLPRIVCTEPATTTALEVHASRRLARQTQRRAAAPSDELDGRPTIAGLSRWVSGPKSGACLDSRRLRLAPSTASRPGVRAAKRLHRRCGRERRRRGPQPRAAGHVRLQVAGAG